ncbi:MAG: hypothetical protein VYC34_10780 [Planctomycetota bacterium]|nr:hypothetical protein [Planctomycetota bacterium]
MTFAKDRDLLVLEPALFRDVSWAGQRLVNVNDAQVTGVTLTTNKADFEALDVGAGHVVLIGGMSLEVVERVSSSSLTVSLLRTASDGPALAPPAGLAGDAFISTFLPQIGQAHRQTLHSGGIDAESEAEFVVNTDDLARVEALGALHLIFAGAAASASPGSLLWEKARMYRDRYIRSRAATIVVLDDDADGKADRSVSLGALTLGRA